MRTFRITTKYKSLAEEHKAQIVDLQKDDVYKSRIAVAAARKSRKAAMNRNKRDKETWT